MELYWHTNYLNILHRGQDPPTADSHCHKEHIRIVGSDINIVCRCLLGLTDVGCRVRLSQNTVGGYCCLRPAGGRDGSQSISHTTHCRSFNFTTNIVTVITWLDTHSVLDHHDKAYTWYLHCYGCLERTLLQMLMYFAVQFWDDIITT